MRNIKKEDLCDELAMRNVSSAGLNKAAFFNLLRDGRSRLSESRGDKHLWYEAGTLFVNDVGIH